MTLPIHPKPGTILRCNYEPGFKAPEMIKVRPVLVVSPRLRKRDSLCAIVPISTSEPDPMMPYHHKLELDEPLPNPYDADVCWVKADMINTVGFHRLDAFFVRDHEGKRKFIFPRISDEELEKVRLCIMAGLGIKT